MNLSTSMNRTRASKKTHPIILQTQSILERINESLDYYFNDPDPKTTSASIDKQPKHPHIRKPAIQIPPLSSIKIHVPGIPSQRISKMSLSEFRQNELVFLDVTKKNITTEQLLDNVSRYYAKKL